MGKKYILVIGSINTDMVIKVKNIPAPGETILGNGFFLNTGGKGANQAVAAAKLGGTVFFIGKVGDDVFGGKCIQSLKNEGIQTEFIEAVPETASGIAMITVDEKGENSIVVAPGANYELNVSDIDHKDALFELSEFIVIQLEIPLETVAHIIQKGKRLGKKVILNPAPAHQLDDKLFEDLYLITPNETEAEILTGVEITDEETAKAAGRRLLDKGVKNVIITLGRKGALVMNSEICEIVAAPTVKAVDTTAAGDTFNGALTVALSEKMDIRSAAEFACKAASISVGRFGAQVSMPYRQELSA